MIHLQETFKLVPGKRDDFMAAVQDEYLPLAETLGLRLMGYWETVQFRGNWPEIVALWEMDNYEVFFRQLCKGRYQDEVLSKRYDAWMQRIAPWVRDLDGKNLVPSKFDQPVAELVKQGFKARVVLHEKMHIYPHKNTSYPEYVRRFCGPSLSKLGIDYFANFYDISNPAECVNFAGSPSWDTYGMWQEYKLGYDQMWLAYHGEKLPPQFQEPEVRAWLQEVVDYSHIGPAFRNTWTTELLWGLMGPLL